MSKKLIVLAMALALVMGQLAWADHGPVLQDPDDPNGFVSFEVEDFTENIVRADPHRWEFNDDRAGFSGTGFMRAVPDDTGDSNLSPPDQYLVGPELLFLVDFTQTGTHYVWVRGMSTGGSDDSVHVGLDGDGTTSDRLQPPGDRNEWVWAFDRRDSQGTAVIDVPTAGLHTINLWMREDGFRADKVVLTTDPNFVPEGEGPAESARGPRLDASGPAPASGTTDIPWYILPELGWRPGETAQTHNVYFSTNLADVADANATALVSEVQAGATYQVMATELETTYYWRVDSIDGDGTVTAGAVWNFTMEAVTFPDPIADVTATADSQFNDGTGPQNTVNGSGLTDGLHGTTGTDMWLSNGVPATIQFDFDRVYSVHEMHVWNQNQAIESLLGLGAKDVTIEVSANGTDFTVLDGVGPLNQAPGIDTAANSTIALGGMLLKSVRMTIDSAFGAIPRTGLSEVQFTAIPAFPRELSPADGTDLDGLHVDLSWRGGRFAVEHQVLVSTDKSAVADGSAVVATTADKSYTLWLEYGNVYSVGIIDVGADGTTYAGPINQYYTPAGAAIDDMEGYNGKKISKSWEDGKGEFANGSTVGLETSLSYEGDQSMSVDYDMALGAYAYVTRTFDPPLDVTPGAPDMVGIYFLGDPNNDPGWLSMEIMDSENRAVRVTYPDAAATTLTSWTLLEIPFSEMDRLNLTEIQSIRLNVRAPGAAGTVLWDYLHVGTGTPSLAVVLARMSNIGASPDDVVAFIEAEAADILGESWRVVADATASGGWRIGSENGDGNDNNTAPGAEWVASYSFTVPAEGVYGLALRALEAGSDSFWVRIVGATSQSPDDLDQPGTGWVRFNGIDAQGALTWDRVHSNDHSNAVVSWTLPTGPLTLEIAKREDGTYVDAIVVLE